MGTELHELAAVQELVDALLASLAVADAGPVDFVRVERGSAFSEDALRQSYAVTTIGTPLHGAALLIQSVPTTLHCECGSEQVVTSDDLHGHMFVCPACG